jgi:hypothetical protein
VTRHDFLAEKVAWRFRGHAFEAKKEKKVKKNRFFGAIFLTLLLATAGWGQIINLVGTNNPAIDVPAVQAAVNVPNATVKLSGIFDFGASGFVVINAPGVTLQGVATGATIKGGLSPIKTFAGSPPTSAAKNFTIRYIHFEGWTGIAVGIGYVQAEDNFSVIEGNTFNNTQWPAYTGYGAGVQFAWSAGSAEIKNNTFLNLRGLAIATYGDTLHGDNYVLIEGNKIMNCHGSAIVPEVWNPYGGLLDLDHGPVIVRNNEINMGPIVISYPTAINAGEFWGYGVSNLVISGNIITGYSYGGIVAGWTGRGRKIVNNDLSGLTTSGPQICTNGREDLIADNILGPLDTVYGSPGILVEAWDPGYGYPSPLTVTKNTCMNNDFRLTGLKGWAYDAATGVLTPGCVLLESDVDFYSEAPWPGDEVTDNLIKETGRFPRGTGGPKQQVLEFPVLAYGNRIVGHAANEYAQLEAANPGIGQKIKASGAKFKEMLLNEIALNKEMLKQMGAH